MIIINKNGITVKELKLILNDLPDNTILTHTLNDVGILFSSNVTEVVVESIDNKLNVNFMCQLTRDIISNKKRL